MTFNVISMTIAIASIILSIYLIWTIYTLRDEMSILRDNNHFCMDRYDKILENWERCSKLVEDVISINRELIAINKRLLKSDDVYKEKIEELEK